MTVTLVPLESVNFAFQAGVSFSRSTPWAPEQLRSVTAKAEANDEALGLDLGAEDYITKPIDKTKLLARIRARTRKTGQTAPELGAHRGRVDYDKLTVDMDGYVLRVDGKVIETPPKELELLYCLASNPNHVYTRDQLLDEVWGFEYYGDSRLGCRL